MRDKSYASQLLGDAYDEAEALSIQEKVSRCPALHAAVHHFDNL